MEPNQNYFKTPANRLEKETYLTNYKYLSGEQLPGEEDAKFLAMVDEPPDRTRYPNLFYWWWSLYPFSEYSRQLWPRKGSGENDGRISDAEIPYTRNRSGFEGKFDPNVNIMADIHIYIPEFERVNVLNIAKAITNDWKIPHVEFSHEISLYDVPSVGHFLKLTAIVEKTGYVYADLQNSLSSRLGSQFKIKIETK